MEQNKMRDDYSFVFEKTDRVFTENEKKDILSLCDLLSTGLRNVPLVKKEFPSLGNFDIYINELRKLQDGVPSAWRDSEQVVFEMQRLGGYILDEKYPEVAGMVRETTGKCRLPAEQTELYMMLDQKSFITDMMFNDENGPDFRSFMESKTRDVLCDHKDGIIPESYFVRYRIGEDILLPTNNNNVEYVKQLRNVVRDNDIKPSNILPVSKVAYCQMMGINPLHPDNQQKLHNEELFRNYRSVLHGEKLAHKSGQPVDNMTDQVRGMINRQVSGILNDKDCQEVARDGGLKFDAKDVANTIAPGAVMADKILSNETGRQVVRDVGMPLLAKKNPAAAAILGGVVALYDAKDAQKIRKPSERENPKPGKKRGRGL